MRTILKRVQTRDARGRPLNGTTERLTDDGRGRVQVAENRTAVWCSGCRRPVESLSELRGVCDVCRARGLCDRCETRCQGCARRLCGRCRRGFAGSQAMTVCPVCQRRFYARQAYLDGLQQRQLALQQEAMRQHEWARVQNLRLHLARLRLNTQLTAAREGNRVRLALRRMRRDGRRYLR